MFYTPYGTLLSNIHNMKTWNILFSLLLQLAIYLNDILNRLIYEFRMLVSFLFCRWNTVKFLKLQMGFSVKSLKKSCVEVIVKTYYYHGNLYCPFNKFYDVVVAFKRLTPALARQTFCKKISARGSDFKKFLWFCL